MKALQKVSTVKNTNEKAFYPPFGAVPAKLSNKLTQPWTDFGSVRNVAFRIATQQITPTGLDKLQWLENTGRRRCWTKTHSRLHCRKMKRNKQLRRNTIKVSFRQCSGQPHKNVIISSIRGPCPSSWMYPKQKSSTKSMYSSICWVLSSLAAQPWLWNCWRDTLNERQPARLAK